MLLTHFQFYRLKLSIFFTLSHLSSSKVLHWLMLYLEHVENILSTYRAKAPQNGSHLLHGKLATQQ